MRSNDIRKAFLDYFGDKGHELVSSSGLIPAGDQTLLFTNAGMVQFKGVFLGEERRDYKRAATVQKCVRAGGKHNDLENVGRTARHHTFFEMLGNFSFGDYFKEGAIEFGWEFLTSVMKLDPEKLWITVYKDDDEAEEIWNKKIGVSKEKIIRLGDKDNFWAMGETGPCGPCSEIHIDQGPEVGCGKPSCSVECECGRYLEVWNLVFMQFNRGSSGELTPLEKPSIDTGMGLERLSAIMQNKPSNYDTDLFMPIISTVEEITGVAYDGSDSEANISIRAIADHSRAITFLITDGVLPSNEGRGYVLRRILRRAVRHGRSLGLGSPFLNRVNDRVISLLGEAYPEIEASSDIIGRATRGEEERFLETLDRGLEILDAEIKALGSDKAVLPGATAFKLYDTYGFPLDLTADIIRSRGLSLTIDEEGFNAAMDGQRSKARKARKGSERGAAELVTYKALFSSGVRSEFVGYHLEAASSRVLCIIKDDEAVESASGGDEVEIITAETPFYAEGGGQVGDTGTIVREGASIKVVDTRRPMPEIIAHRAIIEEGSGSVAVNDIVELVPEPARRVAIRRNHTATHILHALLRKKLGTHVRQAGSLVNDEGLRFDFNHFEAVPEAELREIEGEAAGVVMQNIGVDTETLPYDEAVKRGALAFFEEKYSDDVRVVRVAEVSAELCGGTHVSRSGDIGPICITSESSVAAGVRRIEAVTGLRAMERIEGREELLRRSARLLKSSPAEVPERVERLITEQKKLERELDRLRRSSKAEVAESVLDGVRTIEGIKVLSTKVECEDAKELRELADSLRVKLGSGIVVLAAADGDKAMLLAAVTRDLTKRFNAGEIIKALAPIVGGRGGGRPDMAQAGGKDTSKLDQAVEKSYETIERMTAK